VAVGYPDTGRSVPVGWRSIGHRAVFWARAGMPIFGRPHVIDPVRRAAKTDKDKMTGILADYLPLVIFIGISLVIGIALLAAPFLVAYSAPDSEKLSAYECGFNAFDDARMKFDVRFYLVAILFIIFDLEVAFLFPWAVAFGQLGWFGFWSMMIFLGVLTVGFIYEWNKGALDWD
jgi:NADH-quinone oxidoreductase subunit A